VCFFAKPGRDMSTTYFSILDNTIGEVLDVWGSGSPPTAKVYRRLFRGMQAELDGPAGALGLEDWEGSEEGSFEEGESEEF
jgi:hypothetical protein